MCGIFGTISLKSKAFNKRAFCTMGVRNDSRGGDSCGIFIDGNVEYGIDK
jgi:asparagine synthetase B (glutamine-hydrolysing)